MTERARWLLLVLALIVAFGGVHAVTLLTIAQNQRKAQRDICELVEAYDAEYAAHPPSTTTGQKIAEVGRDYIVRNCWP